MKVVFNIFFVTVLISSCNFKRNAPKAPVELHNISYSFNGNLNLGTFDSINYQNNYFGFSIPVPGKNWTVLNKDQYAERIDKNIDEKKNQGFADSIMNKTKQNVNNLFTIVKTQSGITVTRYQSISFMAEGLERIPNVTNALEYVRYSEKYTKDLLSQDFPKYHITGIDTGIVGNRVFLRTKMEIEAQPNNYYYQDVYTAQFGKYLMNVIVNFKTAEDYADVLGILSTVKWK